MINPLLIVEPNPGGAYLACHRFIARVAGKRRVTILSLCGNEDCFIRGMVYATLMGCDYIRELPHDIGLYDVILPIGILNTEYRSARLIFETHIIPLGFYLDAPMEYQESGYGKSIEAQRMLIHKYPDLFQLPESRVWKTKKKWASVFNFVLPDEFFLRWEKIYLPKGVF